MTARQARGVGRKFRKFIDPAKEMVVASGLDMKTFLLSVGYSGEGEAEFDRILQDFRSNLSDLF